MQAGWETKKLLDTLQPSMRPVLIWRRQIMAIQQRKLATCFRVQRSARRKRSSFSSTGNFCDVTSNCVLWGGNTVAEWRALLWEDQNKRKIGYRQGFNHLSVFDVLEKTCVAFQVFPHKIHPDRFWSFEKSDVDNAPNDILIKVGARSLDGVFKMKAY